MPYFSANETGPARDVLRRLEGKAPRGDAADRMALAVWGRLMEEQRCFARRIERSLKELEQYDGEMCRYKTLFESLTSSVGDARLQLADMRLTQDSVNRIESTVHAIAHCVMGA